jgi:TM2 domain-containing membrane protein YozV
MRPAPPSEKSVAVAGVLTFLWPGLGHVYLGENQKAVPHLIVNCIGFVLAWTLILLPISVVIWAVTLAMTLPGIKQDTAKASADALAEYRRRWGAG